MMAGNPNWWSIMNGMHPHDNHQQQHQLSNSSNSSSTNPQFNHVYGSSSPSNPDHLHLQDSNHFPPVRSTWSQLLLGGIGGGVGEEEERYSAGLFQQQKKLENWEDQVLNLNPSFTNRISSHTTNPVPDVKQEVSQSITCQLYGNHNLDLHHHQDHHDQFHHPNIINKPSNSWTSNTQVNIPVVSSPTSCITTLSNTNSFLNFSGSNPTTTIEVKSNIQHERHEGNISEGSSKSMGGVAKKARLHQSSAQPALKVRKEKLGDRITTLHQLVSPFGKTDTASVLSEAIGYIRFLQGQIEALSTPYMRNGSGSTSNHIHNQHSVIQIRSCLFGEDLSQDSHGQVVKDLRSRGLCLVPISCTQHVGNDNGADYWAPTALGGGF